MILFSVIKLNKIVFLSFDNTVRDIFAYYIANICKNIEQFFKDFNLHQKSASPSF